MFFFNIRQLGHHCITQSLESTGEKLPIVKNDTLIFGPIADKEPRTGDDPDSLTQMLSKCQTLKEKLKNPKINTLIFPLCLQDREHWITAKFDMKEQKMVFIDSGLLSTNLDLFIAEFNTQFEQYRIKCKSHLYQNQYLQLDDTSCAYWTLANITDPEYLSNITLKIRQKYQLRLAFDMLLLGLGGALLKFAPDLLLALHIHCIFLNIAIPVILMSLGAIDFLIQYYQANQEARKAVIDIFKEEPSSGPNREIRDVDDGYGLI